MPVNYSDGLYYINANDNNRVTKLWTENRQIKKERITSDSVICFLVADGVLYGADDKGSPFALDITSGRKSSMGNFSAINVYVTYDSVYYRALDGEIIVDSNIRDGAPPPNGDSFITSTTLIRTGEWHPPEPPEPPPGMTWDPPPTPPPDKPFNMSGRYEIIGEMTVAGFVVPFEIGGNYIDLLFRNDGTGHFDTSINDNSGNPFLGSGEAAEFEFVFKDSILYMRDPRNRTGQTSNMNDVDYYAYFIGNVFHLRGYTIEPGGMGYRITLIKQD